MDIKPAAILTSPAAKEIAKTFAMSAAASVGSLAGMGLVLIGYDKVSNIRANKKAKKDPNLEQE